MKHGSIRFKFFAAISIIALVFIGILVLLNVFFYQDYYMMTRRSELRDAYGSICTSYASDSSDVAALLDSYYADAAKRYQVRAVCAVGMGQTGTQTDEVRKKNRIPASIPLFTLQGNFDIKKLHGIYRPMMELMVRTAGKGLSKKDDRTPEEDDMLDMMLHGGQRVRVENLRSALDWYRAQE